MEAPRSGYPTDLSDSQWQLARRLIPASRPIGADRSTSMRAVVNAILYRRRSGCSWRMLPHDFPHWRTVYGYFRQWVGDGTWARIQDALRENANPASVPSEEQSARRRMESMPLTVWHDNGGCLSQRREGAEKHS